MTPKLRFAFGIPGLPFVGDTMHKQSLGGSETAAACLARELAALGDEVFVFTTAETQENHDGVRYQPFSSFQMFAVSTPHDVCVIQRAPGLFVHRYESRLNVLWQHDMAQKRVAQQVSGVMWNIDRVALLSDWMVEQYHEVMGLDRRVLWRTRNGIDLKLFEAVADVEHLPKRLFYGARPERGLDVLLDKILPRLLKIDPDLQLCLATYHNPTDQLAGYYQALDQVAAGFGRNVVNLGPLNKTDLYREIAKANLVVYPTPGNSAPGFREISCITAMEAMACGTPFVSSALGALPETLAPGAGTLVEGTPQDDDYCDRFVDAVRFYLDKPEERQRASTAGRAAAAGLDWRGVAEQWHEDCARAIGDLNDSPARLVHHFCRRSNIVMARRAARDAAKTPDVVRKLEWIDRDFSFADTDADYAAQYAQIGETHTDCYETAKLEPRLANIMDWFAEHPEIVTVLDVGCGLGIYAIELSNRFPALRITGVDIDPRTIEWCDRYREQHAQHPKNLTFCVGRESDVWWTPTADHPGDFDCVLAGEVLEHLPKPWAFLSEIEAHCRRGGWVYITVPYGRWEELSYETYPHRCHLWEFDESDFEDMLSGKPRKVVNFGALNVGGNLGGSFGHFHVYYEVDHQRVPALDRRRKASLQRPRETVSVTMIAGGPAVEETAHWSFRSVKDVADEIIVVDCGLSVEGRRIVEQYADTILDSPPPTEVGFETPRNLALDAATCDWVLWLDCDERLMGTANVDKYLRRNIFDGYSIRQHHFAVDGSFPADMPVRLFRRHRHDAKTMRFWGMIHEHPEIDINEGPGHVLVVNDVHIAHVGYLTETQRRRRFERNTPLLQKDIEKYPGRKLQKHFIMRDSVILAEFEITAAGGQLTPNAQRLLNDVLRIYREHFLGQKTYTNVDSLRYYTRALELLGQGVEVSFDIRAARDGVGEPLNGAAQPVMARFADADEAEREIARRLHEKLEPLTGNTW